MDFKPHIYIPIEILYREINSRLILALSACLKGYRVYIGSKSGIDRILNFKIKKKIKGGIYLNKSQIISNPKYLNKIKKICNHFVVIDEELTPGVVNLKEVIINRTINEEKISKFFVSGKKIKKDILKYKKNFKCEIVTSGWPKYDVYRKQYSKLHLKEAQKIRKKFGKFLLFVSNYGAVSKKGLKIHISNLLKLKKRGYDYKSQIKTMKDYYNDFKYMIRCFNDFRNNNNDMKIVVRPHPSDYFHSEWHNKLIKNNNTSVVYDNDIIPWIIASDGIIHRGCSTSIDAFFLKKKIFFFLPKRKLKEREKNLTYKISKKFKKFDELKYLITRPFNHNRLVKKNIGNHLFFHPKKTSTQIIVDKLMDLKTSSEKSFNFNEFSNLLRSVRGYIGFYKNKFQINPELYGKKSMNKFPTIMTLSYFKKKTNEIYKNKKFKIKKLSYDLFEFDI